MSVLVALLVLAAVLLTGPLPDPRPGRLLTGLGVPPAEPRRGRMWRPRGARRPLRPSAPDAPLLLDLVAAALDAGTPPGTALEVAVGALGRARPGPASPEEVELRRRCGLLRLGASWDEAWADVGPALRPLVGPLGLAARAGAPGAALLRDSATELRRRRSREAERRAQALGVRLVLPLGACALPAFALVGVVPVVLALAGRVLQP